MNVQKAGGCGVSNRDGWNWPDGGGGPGGGSKYGVPVLDDNETTHEFKSIISLLDPAGG